MGLREFLGKSGGRILEPEVMEGDAEAAAYDELDRTRGNIIFQGFAESALHMGVRQGLVLDVGTGSGRVAIRLAKLNSELAIVAIDLSRSMLDLARGNAARDEVDNVQFSLGDAKQIPYDNDTFDLVICHQLLHQLPDPLVVLREINRVAKPQGGILVRDIRRLPEPLMSLAMPFWCLGHSRRLREQTAASFRAALTAREFRDLMQEADIQGAVTRTHLLTHQSIERPATPYETPPLDRLPHYSRPVRAMKSYYVSRPERTAKRTAPLDVCSFAPVQTNVAAAGDFPYRFSGIAGVKL
jgi:ubiquinone/menaquinone biosynthesis C-methylase UbiE